MGKKVFYSIIDNECKEFYSEDGVLKFEETYDLYGYHLEGDTRVMFHTKHANLIDPGNIVQLMQKNEKFVDAFTNIRSCIRTLDFPMNTDTLNVFQEFTCHLYGHVKLNDVHEVIKLHFGKN